MKKSKRFQFIIDFNAQQEKQALEELGQCQKKRQELLQQLLNLQKYRQEYQQKHEEQEEHGVSINRLLEFRAFLEKLDKAIIEQEQLIQAKDQDLKACRKNWEQKYQKTRSLQKVADIAAGEEIRLENKREQSEQDERASRMGRKAGTGSA